MRFASRSRSRKATGLDWGGEYSEYVAAREQFAIIGPLAILLIFMILFALYGNFKFSVTVMIGVVMTEPVGALIALKLTHTAFSVSSVLGLLALMGVSVETAVILVSYINKLRLESHDIRSATREAARTPGSAHHDDRSRGLPGTLARGSLPSGSDRTRRSRSRSRIVAGLISRLFLGFSSIQCSTKWSRSPGDVLQV